MTDIFWEEIGGTLFEEAGDALFLFDPESEQVRQVNPMAQRLSGFNRRELLEMKVTQIIRSEVDNGLQRLRQAFRRTGLFHSQEGFWLRNKGEAGWVPVNLTITRLHTQPRPFGLITARDISERRQSLARLQEAEAELRRVLASVSDCLWSAEVDREGKWTNRYVSPVVEKVTGRSAESYLADPSNWLKSLHPDDRGRMVESLKRVHQGLLTQEEYRVVWPDGTIRWVRDSVVGRWSEDGSRMRLDGVLSDITQRKEAELALQENQRILATLMSNLPGMAYRCRTDPRWTMEFVSEGALELTGYRPEDLVGNHTISFAELIHPFDREPVWNEVQAALKANRPFRLLYRIRTAQEKEKWVWEQGRGVLGPDGQLLALEGFITDTTDRKNAEEALRSSEAKYRTLIENLAQTIFLKDRDLRFVAVNQPFCRNLGRTEQEIVGKTDFDFFPKEMAEKYRADDRMVLQEKRRVDIEEQNLQHGRILTVQTVKTPVLNDEGEAVGVLGIFWDVTDQRNMEAQLRQAHKMEAVGQLAGGIAHDFNNLLTGVLGNIALALADLPEGHPCHELLASAETAGLRAAELTRQLLGFSRRTPLLPKPVDLNASIDETVRLLRRTFDPRVDVEIRCEPHLWPIQADGGQIGQVLMNLCLNARDAMPQGGTLTLETANVRLDGDAPAHTLEGRPGDFVHLRVSDTGSGMPVEVQERIFEPFFTTKEPGKGTGLGLAMVFGIVKQHEGWIECQSEPGKGTRFDIFMPRLVQPATLSSPPPVLDGSRGGHETILLADDEEVVGRLGQTILERHGYRVLHALDGIEAIELYRQRIAEIDLVILDLSMPRLSGSDTLRELRKVNPTVKVLISSGYSSDEDLRNVENQGAIGFVAKPYRPAELARRVRAALDLKAPSNGG